MLSLPDFKEKQILFIQAERGVYNKIKFSNDNIVFSKNNETINRASCHKVFVVFVIGDITITSGLMKDGLKHGVSFFFLKNNFEVYASIGARSEGNYLLRMRQYALSKEEELRISQNIIKNKVNNQLSLLQNKNGGKAGDSEKQILEKISNVKNQKELLGLEGSVSKKFFNEYFKEIGWFRRMPRVKPDIPNFMLDLGYTLLFNFVDSLLRLYGFDNYKGFYHQLFFQRKSLTCDIVEPFRCIIDRQLIKSYNLKQINEKDFKVKNQRYYADFDKSQKYAKVFMEAIMDKKEPIYLFVHDFYRFIMDNENPFPYFKIN